MNLKFLSGVAAIAAGFIAVMVGLWKGEVGLLTFGAGLMGAPGFAEVAMRNGVSDG